MKHFQFIILCWLLSWSCLAQARTEDRLTPGSDTITVIMENIPPAQTQLDYCGTKQSVISPFYSSYVNDVGDLIWVKQQGKASDTLRIITKRDIVAWRLVRAGSLAAHTYPLEPRRNERRRYSLLHSLRGCPPARHLLHRDTPRSQAEHPRWQFNPLGEAISPPPKRINLSLDKEEISDNILARGV